MYGLSEESVGLLTGIPSCRVGSCSQDRWELRLHVAGWVGNLAGWLGGHVTGIIAGPHQHQLEPTPLFDTFSLVQLTSWSIQDGQQVFPPLVLRSS